MSYMVSVLLLSTLLLMCPCIGMATVAGAEYVVYRDPKQPLSRRIDDLFGRMTLAEKIGQMSQIEQANATADIIKKYFIGSVVSGPGSLPAAKAPPETWVDMVNEMQRAALSTPLGIPILSATDTKHGAGNVYNATIFPHNVGLGCTRDPKLAKEIGSAMALEVRATGFPYALGPCAAVCRDPRWGRCYESFSEDPEVVQRMVTAVISGLQGDVPTGSESFFPGGQRKVAACALHFVGDGGTTDGDKQNSTFDELLRVHMPPFSSAVRHGVSTVLVSSTSWHVVKMHANRFLLTDFLKTRLRFKGFVISDWKGIDGITTPAHADYLLSIKLAITAGIDMGIIPYTYTEFIDGLTKLVHNGDIPMSRIDDAVRRILRVKLSMGLFESPYGSRGLAGEIGKKEHRELARESVRKSLVLLKNGKAGDKPLLPLPRSADGRSILVAGRYADDLGSQCGGWTVTWQGVAGNKLIAGTTILGGIRQAVQGHGTDVVYRERPDAGFMRRNKARFDYAAVVVGEPPYAEAFGDSLNLTIPAPGPSLIRDVCGSVRCVVVLVAGRPLVVEPWLDAVDALVAAWLPGTEGQGVSDVLFGDYGFTGKLARTWFRRVEQLPMNVGDAHYDPLFPLGFGLQTQPLKA